MLAEFQRSVHECGCGGLPVLPGQLRIFAEAQRNLHCLLIWEKPAMKFFRYRRPSWKTALGVTRAKKRVRKALGITALLAPFRWWPNQVRTAKRRLGWYSPLARLIRLGLPRPGGCLVLIAAGLSLLGAMLGACILAVLP
ncbi:MAG: hypothetical protein ACK6EB_03145 [Planctomyces sp.]